MSLEIKGSIKRRLVRLALGATRARFANSMSE